MSSHNTSQVLHNKILEKPGSPEHAKEVGLHCDLMKEGLFNMSHGIFSYTQMLRSLSNTCHHVYTAVVLVLPHIESILPPGLISVWDSRMLYSERRGTVSSAIPREVRSCIRRAIRRDDRQLCCHRRAHVILLRSFAHLYPMFRDKAGGYGIQEVHGGSFVKEIHGCYYNIVGFPLHRFCKEVIALIETGAL